jgi:hypothetical protein
VFYTADWNSIKLSAAAAYTWQESSALYGTLVPGFCDFPGGVCFNDQDSLKEDNLFQIGASILHKPSGLGIYGMYQTEETSGSTTNFIGFNNLTPAFANAVTFKINNPQTDVRYVKPFWRKTWTPAGATTLFGEYGQYNDQFAGNAGSLCGAFDGLFGTNVDNLCNSGDFPNYVVAPIGFNDPFQSVFVIGSEVQRWGLGVVQEIDSAAIACLRAVAAPDGRRQPDGLQGQCRLWRPLLAWCGLRRQLHQDPCQSKLRRLGSVPGRRHHLLLS